MTNNPIDDRELEDIYQRCDVSNNRTDNPMGFEEFKAWHLAETNKARLIELDLLEQAINSGWDMNKYKLHRLEKLTEVAPQRKKEL